MRSLLILVRWVVGCFLCFASIGGFLSGEGGTAIFVLILGLIIIPPVTRLIFSSKKHRAFMAEKSQIAKTPSVNGTPQQKFAILSQSQDINGKSFDTRGHESIPVGKVNIPISTSSFLDNNASMDDSILDITGEESIIPMQKPSNPNIRNVVPWEHRYIYTNEELKLATKAQQDYYSYFKEHFLSGDFLELQGYTNYAFILLFDLLSTFDITKDIQWLEKQLDFLGHHYPRTYSYTRSSLLSKMSEIRDIDGIRRIKLQMAEGNPNTSTEYYWGLGKLFKDKLSLDNESEQLLNKIWYQGNNFYGIPFCQEQILKLFVKVINIINAEYSTEGTSIEQEFDVIGDLVARKQFKYRRNSNNYIYCLQSVRKDLYILILKYCENAVRDHYEHKRKLSADSYEIAKDEIEARILQKVNQTIRTNTSLIDPPNDETELELNAQNTNRWKMELEKIEQLLPSNTGEWFLGKVMLLGIKNKKNPSVENIFYESSKIIAKHDKVTALILYLHYIDHDLRSKEFDNKPIAKSIQKSLFTSMAQVQEFENLIQELIDKRDLDNVIAHAKKFYVPKRRKIQLDQELIDSTKSKYEDTVELLGNFLEDDSIELEAVGPRQENQEPEIQIILNKNISQNEVIASQNEVIADSSSIYLFSLNTAQKALLRLFVKSNFVVSAADAQALAKSNGLFVGSLVESINDLHFEYLDDVLIEEEEDVFVISEKYYNKILSNEHDN